MMLRGVALALVLLGPACRGQLPNLTWSTQTAGALAGGAIADTVAALTKLPIAVANALGPAYAFPTLASHSNVVDLPDRFLAEVRSHRNNEDAELNIQQLIIKYGHPVEAHTVQTEDGYILTMYRIPARSRSSRASPLVFLMHGLLGSSDDYVIAGPESGLAYLLANEGYDVWMGNARGNKHSRRHVRFVPSESIYWDFSWHEIGYYDLPSMIDYALDATNSSSLKYIGHSQGTTVFFVMTSERAEYNKKVSLMVALSPVAFMGNVVSPIVRLLAPGGPLLYSVSSSLGIYEFLPDNKLTRLIKQILCGTDELADLVCNNLIFLVAGFDYEQMNATNLPVVLGHMPSGASSKQFLHYGQGVISKEFRQFNLGIPGNLLRYGTLAPPRYKLEQITAPVSLFYSDADWLAHPDDVQTLNSQLSNTVDVYKVPFDNFNHLDFLLAKDFKTLIYKRLRKLLSLF